jgi:SAM-dependent methyltransferase
MAHETSKANIRRIGSPLFQRVFRGEGIEFGAGDDPLDRERLFPAITALEICDSSNGNDAEHPNMNVERYDFVYSSHCLEHLRSPKTALKTWFSLVKPGGFLILTVPDEDLYEQGHWPSRFNHSHRWTFTIHKESSWSPVSINILDLVKAIAHCRIIKLEVVDTNYDYACRGVDQTRGNAEAAIEVVLQKTGDTSGTPRAARRVCYNFTRHRIGDKVAMSAVLRWYREQHPEDWFIAVDDYWFENGIQRSMPSGTIFSGLIDECLYNTTPRNAIRLAFGCIWIRVPWVAQLGYYPSIMIDGESEERMLRRFPWMTEPYICVHILEDARYNGARNHDFTQMRRFLSVISALGAHVVRIGRASGRTLLRQTDLTLEGLSIMESACIIKHAAAYIGGDTGMTHIASATGVPWILALYGPPVDEERWREEARSMGCDVGFCSLPSVPEEKRTVFHMHNHHFPMTPVLDACVERLQRLNVL